MKNIKVINNKILENIFDLLQYFKLEWSEHGNKISLPCPIHGGDKRSGVTIYSDTGKWYCWTKNCHEDLQTNLFAFFKAILQKNTKETIDWFENYFGCKIEESAAEDKNLSKIQTIFSSLVEQNGIPRYKVLDSLKIPSSYFQKRGFSAEILHKYDVGDCHDIKKKMYKRAVVPIYDIEHKIMTGCVGRRIIENTNYPKWVNSTNFKRAENLYNIWYAKKYIEETGTIIIVEGQGDVWRLEESGIKNSVGIFGSSITDGQLLMLEKMPIFNMVLLTDSDAAGIEARYKIRNKCQRLYNIIDIEINKKDVGEMSKEDIKNIIIPKLEIL